VSNSADLSSMFYGCTSFDRRCVREWPVSQNDLFGA
jgi:hypothetical protein